MFRWLFQNPKPELVPFHDFETKLTVQIPKSELSPGVVLIQIEGQAEPVYANPEQLQFGGYQHDELPDELLEAIGEFMDELKDVYPQSMEEWVDGFRRDQNPDREIAGWVHLSSILRIMSDRNHYSLPQRKECFRVLIACFTGDRSSVRDRSKTDLLPASQVDQAINYFYDGGYK